MNPVTNAGPLVSLDDYCPLQNNDDAISLSVEILGNNQAAESTVRSGTRSWQQRDGFTIALGDARSLLNGVLYIDTATADTNLDPADNYTGIRIRVSGGPRLLDRVLSASVNPGATEAYKVSINFYELV